MCLFQEWASLAEEVVAHEFPSWHLFAAFEVFNLADEGKRQNPDVVRNLQRLAQAFAVCPEKLKEQYARLMPIATAIKKQGGLSNRDAWKEALQRTSSRKGAQNQRHEHSALREVIAPYQGWTAASSGVEQLFSKLKRSPVELSNASAETDRRTACVMGDGQAVAAMADIVTDARQIYASLLHSGVARPRTRVRFDCGTKGGCREGTFAHWNRNRKQAVAEAVQSYTTPPRKPSAVQTVSALKERDFQRKHALKRKAEALADGLLLPDEVTEDVRTEAVRVAKTNKQADQQRAKKRRDYELGGHLTSTTKTPDWACQGLTGPAWFCQKLGPQEELHKRLQGHSVTNFTEDNQK